MPKKGNDGEYTRVKQACSQGADLCVAYRFELPPLKVGTLDSLMALCDELVRVDTLIEGACRRLVALRLSLSLPGGPIDTEPLTVDSSKFLLLLLVYLFICFIFVLFICIIYYLFVVCFCFLSNNYAV